jgi:hypothetical protein
MSSLQKFIPKTSSPRRNLFFERVMAVLALVNLLLVIFDISYIPLRDFWLQGRIKVFGLTLQVPLPPLTQGYDPIKALNPTETPLNI